MIQKFCYHGNVTSHFFSLFCCESCDAIFPPKQRKSKKIKNMQFHKQRFSGFRKLGYIPLLRRCVFVVHFLPLLPFLSERERPFLINSFHAYASIVRGKVAFDQLGVKVWQSWTASDTGKGLLTLHSRSFSRQSRIIFMPNTVFFPISARIPGHDFGESHLPPYFNRILRIILEIRFNIVFVSCKVA